MPYCHTVCMNVFLRELSVQFSDDVIMLCCDGAAWHKSCTLEVPDNIVLFYLPPYTPEMNPIEQIWKELRKIGFQTRFSPHWRKLSIDSVRRFALFHQNALPALPVVLGLLKRLIKF